MTYPTNPSSRAKLTTGHRKLGEVYDLYQPKTISKAEMVSDGQYKVYGANGVIGRYDKYNHEQSEILVTCRGATCGTVNVSEPKAWINGNAMVVRPKSEKEISKKYTYYLLKGGIDMSAAISGSAQPQITRATLFPIEIPLPPLSEQKKIVAKLEKVLAKISEAKKLRAEARENADNLLSAELHKIFAEGKKKGWQEKELGEVCEKTSNIKWNEHRNKSFQYIDLTSVSREDFSITKTKVVNFKNAPSRAKKLINTNDVIFGTTRPTLMRVTIIPPEYNNHICSTGFAVLRARKDHVFSQFIYYFIRSERFMDRMESIQTGASYPAVSDAKVLETKIPLPPLAEQKRIVKHLDSLSQKLQKLQEYQKTTQSDFLTLEQSVLSKAFSI